MSAPICFLDVESDGLHPGRKAWEAAFIRREPDGTEMTEHFYLSIDLSTADPAGLRVGRFYDRHPMGMRISHLGRVQTPTVKPITQAAPLIARMTHGAQIVGAVPSFDTEILDRLLREQGLIPGWHYRLTCVETLTAGHLRRHVGGLGKCAEALGVPIEGEHTALGDTRTAMRIYDAVMGTTRLEAVA
ncbi:MAG: hypothetical protein HIU88_10105 [Acidobacteria bacterium]|nr:hypothetical protein [Acidobacteriota bacterium]